MKKLFLLLILLFVSIHFLTGDEVKNIYGFKVKDIDGKEVDLSIYKGKTILIVNVASRCGNTPQYKTLMELTTKYKDKNFVVLGFPANEFGAQEPGTNEEIKKFCTANYSVTFPMFSKVVVKGKDQAPLFQYLTTAENPDAKGDIKWNFEKFLIGRNGEIIGRFKSEVEPSSKDMLGAIEGALNTK